MKVNLNKNFTDAFGKTIEGKNIAEQLCMYLFNLSTMQGNPVPADRKYIAYKLCNHISSCPDEVELTAEECALVKELSNEAFSAGAYGQIVDIIESK